MSFLLKQAMNNNVIKIKVGLPALTMGTDLASLVKEKRISFERLLNKKIAVDAMNTIYQFLSIIRQRDGTPLKDSKGRTTSHLSGLYYRTTKWISKGLKPIFVYDGQPPQLKAAESTKRRRRREEAEEEWQKLKEEGKVEAAYVKATQSSKVNEEMIKESKKLLDAMGVPWIQAPSEGEAQAAWMNRKGLVYAVGSQDYDSLLFGCEKMVRNLSITGKRKVTGKKKYEQVVPELIETAQVLDRNNLELEQLRWLAILIGTDFDPGGVTGIGPKTALKLVKEYDDFNKLLADDKVRWEHDNDPYQILSFLQQPPLNKDVNPQPGEVKIDRLRELLIAEHGFSDKRINNALDKLRAAKQESQSDLGSYF